MQDSITVSVVIPTFNRRECLQKALRTLLRQSCPYDKYEIIIVDDYSTDGTRELVEGMAKDSDVKISYYANNRTKGQTMARNIGFQKAKGKYVASTDDDVQVSEHWIIKGVSYFKSSDISAVEGRTVSKDTKPLPFYRNISLNGGTYATCNMFYRKTVLREVGWIDENLNRWKNYGSDYALALSIMKKGGRIVYGSDVVVYHPSYKLGSLTTIKRSLRAGAVAYLYKKYGAKITPYLGFKIRHFVIGFLWFSLITSVIFSNYLAMLVSLVSIVSMVYITFIYMPGFINIGIKAKLKVISVYSISCFFSTLSFLYECLRFRVLPTKKIFRL